MLLAIDLSPYGQVIASDETAIAPLRGEYRIGNDGRLIVLPVRMGGLDFHCVVDTGATLSSFDIRLKGSFGPPTGTRTLTTPAGRMNATTYDWPAATLGGQVLQSRQPIVGLDLAELRRATNQNVLGVIGIDVLTHNRVQFDFERGVLRFLEQLPDEPVKLGRKIPIEFFNDGSAYLNGSVGDDAAVKFVIDTGSQGNSLEESVFDRLAETGEIQLGADFASVTVAGIFQGERGKLSNLTVGPFSHENLRVSRINFNSLGVRYLSRFLVTFDFPDRCVYLKPAKTPRPEPKATSGMQVSWIEGRAVIQSVKADGPAAAADLRRGDVLIHIDGNAETVGDPHVLRQRLTSEAGDHVILTVRRSGRNMVVKLVLAAD